MEHRVSVLEKETSAVKSDIVDIKTRLAVAENNIKDMKDDIQSIKGDTTWLRRAFTGAIITTVIGGVIGGTIALVFWAIKGGN